MKQISLSIIEFYINYKKLDAAYLWPSPTLTEMVAVQSVWLQREGPLDPCVKK